MQPTSDVKLVIAGVISVVISTAIVIERASRQSKNGSGFRVWDFTSTPQQWAKQLKAQISAIVIRVCQSLYYDLNSSPEDVDVRYVIKHRC